MSFVERLGMGMKGEFARAEDARRSFPSPKSNPKPTPAQVQDRLTVEIDAYTKVINSREAALKELKRRRRSLITQRTVRKLHADPEVQARRLANVRAHFQKPTTLAEQSARARAVHLRKGTLRPEMTPEEFREYRRLLRKMPRPDVLKLMGLSP